MRVITAFAAGVLMALAVLFSTVAAAEPAGRRESPGQLTIIATLFPQFDFARQIAGNKANVRLLLPPGAESHSFEPTPSDMKAIADADIFIYTGAHMEPWAKRLADSAAVPAGVIIVDASEDVDFIDSDTGEKHEHDGPDAHAESAPIEHNHAVDPHIWLDPVMAKVMADNINAALEEKDPANASFYQDNTRILKEELDKLNHDFAARIATLPRRLLVFGERFAFAYFFSRYHLESASPFNSCAPGAEPGLRAVIDTINLVKREDIKYIYVEAMTTSRMADLISRETGAGILYVDSLHNPPLEKQLSGASYQSVMRETMDAFAKGLE